MAVPVDYKCESEKVVSKVEGLSSWSKNQKDAGTRGPITPCGDSPACRMLKLVSDIVIRPLRGQIRRRGLAPALPGVCRTMGSEEVSVLLLTAAMQDDQFDHLGGKGKSQ